MRLSVGTKIWIVVIWTMLLLRAFDWLCGYEHDGNGDLLVAIVMAMCVFANHIDSKIDQKITKETTGAA